ncbi:MAG: hypothetical protein ABI846_08295 [Rudaea sp.]
MNAPDPNEFDKSGWIAQARDLLDQSADGLDAATLSRLNRARQAALATRARRSHFWMLPAGLAGTCALLLAAAVWMPRHGVSGAIRADTPATSQATDSTDAGDALASDDSPEFYQDLDFYAWLDAQRKDGAG